jgi:hypothetical protein
MKIKQFLYELITLLAGFPPAGYQDDKPVKQRRGSMHLCPDGAIDRHPCGLRLRRHQADR